MKYTTKELSDILGIDTNTIWTWITKGISSSHPNNKGKVIKLKAEEIAGKGQGGKAYLISASAIEEFMTELYKNSYFFAWWRK